MTHFPEHAWLFVSQLLSVKAVKHARNLVRFRDVLSFTAVMLIHLIGLLAKLSVSIVQFSFVDISCTGGIFTHLPGKMHTKIISDKFTQQFKIHFVCLKLRGSTLYAEAQHD